MTDQTPGSEVAVRPAELPTIRRQDPDSWIPVVQNYAALAERLASTAFVPKDLRGKPEAVAAALLYGREVGLSPMTALTQTHVIEGKPAMSAEAMRAMILGDGHELEVLHADGGRVVMRGRRRGSSQWTELEWSVDMARAAGLLGKDNWRKYPRAMLTARCTADLARMLFPDVIHGMRAVEEASDEGLLDAPAEDPEPAAPAQTVKRTRKAAQRPSAAAEGTGKPPRNARPLLPLPGEKQSPETSRDGSPDPRPGAVSDTGRDGSSSAPTDPAEEESGTASAGETPGNPPAEAPVEAEVVSEEEATVEVDPPAGLMSKSQGRLLHGSLSRLGIKDRGEYLGVCGQIARRRVESTSELRKGEASSIIDTLARFADKDALDVFLATFGGPDAPPLPDFPEEPDERPTRAKLAGGPPAEETPDA